MKKKKSNTPDNSPKDKKSVTEIIKEKLLDDTDDKTEQDDSSVADDEVKIGGLESNNSPIRKLKHFFKSGSVTIGIDHFLAMFPSTILVPLIINNKFGEKVIDPSLVLLTSGLGTLIFILVTRCRIPAYLGSSFAYIGITSYLITSLQTPDFPPSAVYICIGWSYIISALLLLLLGKLYKTRVMSKVLNLIPAAIIGPAISLIGLELSDTAAADSGLNTATGEINTNSALIAVVTLLIIIIISVIRRRILKNASILIGMIGGCLLSIFINGADFSALNNTVILSVPDFHLPLSALPPNLGTVGFIKLLTLLTFNVIPATLVIFTENISRITVIDRMCDPNRKSTKLFDRKTNNQIQRSLYGHGVSMFFSALIGSVPNTIYAENIAVMSINNTDVRGTKAIEKDKHIRNYYNNFSVLPYCIAAIFAITASFFGVIQDLLGMIPKPVIGGMELFLFGIIAAPGIQLLVEQKVNYRKISNQILTASVLVAGISGFTVNIWFVELKGMGLGLFIGIAVNIMFKLIELIGKLNERMTFSELLCLCLDENTKNNNQSQKKLLSICPLHPDTNTPFTQSDTDNSSKGLFETMNAIQSKLLTMQPQAVKCIIEGDIWGLKSKDTPDDDIYQLDPDLMHNYIETADFAEIGTEDSDKPVITLKATSNRLLMIVRLSQPKAIMLAADYNDIIDEDKETTGVINITINGELSKYRLRKIIKEAFCYASENNQSDN